MSYEPRLTHLQPPQHTPSESLTGLPARPPVLATDHSARALPADPMTAALSLPTVDMARRSTAASSFPTPEGMASIRAEYYPTATPDFQIVGPNSTFAREVGDRIRAAIANSGMEWEPGLMQLVAHWTVVRSGSGSDLALACTALAAVGVIDPAALNGVAMIGELGLDGTVRSVRDVTETVRIAQEAGYKKFIVSRDDFDEVSENIDITPVGANDLTAALAFLFEMHEPETTPQAPQAPTQGTPGKDAGHCAQCGQLLIWDGSGKRLNDEWGEYLCTGPRQPGRRSSVHLLAK
ncbi:magnesium chelatase domain-containing protein [Streptomyces sp. NPDC050988]|uniref:magnesium chelatase domain-containing protein n=1 Tax=Streptomyces sp. NPDC050988 TaxID=3365637 RepID=UPI0037AB16CC